MLVRDRRHRELVVPSLAPDALRARGDDPCLIAGSTLVTYAELADRVEVRTIEFGATRHLVLLEMDARIEAVVSFLAAIAGRHPVIVADPDGDHRVLRATFAPDSVIPADGSGRRDVAAGSAVSTPTVPDRNGQGQDRDGTREFHPDLAVLLSTSGSTGAGKLVRLSHDAVTTNAAAIATYLGLNPADRAITSLPLHYCYGLSVLTSHLVAGASVVLTDTAVVDPCFWSAVEEHGVTGISGVPYTFDLLDRLGPDALDVPTLRYVTQAGGALDAGRVRSLAERGREAGWGFYAMYGQTEATARMAYLPPEFAVDHPGAVGVAIPGGTIRIDRSAGTDQVGEVGEIVYSGPNVMMGYATSTDDLARGHDLDELRTGDLGRLDDEGLLHIVGRLGRFVKIHGKRIDLDHLESALGASGTDVRCVGDDGGLVVARLGEVAIPGHAERDDDLASAVGRAVSLPIGRVRAVRVEDWPRTTSGKVDGPALVALGRSNETDDEPVGAGPYGSVADLFALVLGTRDVAPDATFAGLGGDSFSYVEASVRLEELFGELPIGWHLTPVGDLQQRLDDRRPTTASRPRRSVALETTVVVRAIGIALIVMTHMGLYRVAGGAHTLLAVLGWNIARFQLLPHDVAGRLRRAVSTVARVAVPTSGWIAINMVLVGGYSLGAMLLVNNYTGDAARRGGRWEYWYFEAFVQVMVVIALLFSIRAVRRTERRAPFLFALGVLAVTLLFRFDVVQWGGAYNEIFRTHTVAAFVALGWCAQRAGNVAQRLLVTALLAVTTFGYFASVGYTGAGQVDREWRIFVLVAAMIWLPTVRLPRPIAVIVGQVAAASMWIFLLHWQVWPLFTSWLDRHAAFIATMAVGVVAWHVTKRIRDVGQRRRVIGRRTSSQVSAAETPISVSDARPVDA